VIRLTLGERVYDYDESAPLSAGDLMAIREMGADPAKWAGMSAWLREDGQVAGELTDRQYAEVAESLIQLAYLAAVRADHSVTWREFIWSLPIDNTKDWKAEVLSAPTNRAERRAAEKKAPRKRTPKAAPKAVPKAEATAQS